MDFKGKNKERHPIRTLSSFLLNVQQLVKAGNSTAQNHVDDIN